MFCRLALAAFPPLGRTQWETATTHKDHSGKVHLDPIYWLEMEATATSPRSAPPRVRFPNPLYEVTFKSVGESD